MVEQFEENQEYAMVKITLQSQNESSEKRFDVRCSLVSFSIKRAASAASGWAEP